MSDRELPLLLHSLTMFSSEILDCLEIVRPSRIVEIGSESGGVTMELAEWARAHDAVLVTIDPDPAPVVQAASSDNPSLEVVTGASPAALAGLERGDVYVIDGDHNHWTVLEELRFAFGDGDSTPLVVLHDIAWPCARRDQYYAPERLPGGAVHEHSFRGGVRPGNPGLVADGFQGAGAFARAIREGGSANGVLTAVEDFMDERAGLELLRIPCVFGLGFLYPADAPWADALRGRLKPLDGHPLLATLERNRLDLYLRLLDLQHEAEEALARYDRMFGAFQAQIGALEADNARLRLQAAKVD